MLNYLGIKIEMQKYFLILLIMFILGFAQGIFASTTDGTVSGYAWSDQIGWVNFGTTNGNVHVTDSAVTGYAWNENTGRLSLAPTTSGVTNNAEGTLAGRAWNEGTGWINFSGVTINSSGVFSGTATGDNSVNIYFSCTGCSVTTDWRPESSRAGISCGDGTCNGTENCNSCSADCGVCNVGGSAEFVPRQYPWQELAVEPPAKIEEPAPPSIAKRIGEILKPLIPEFLQPAPAVIKPVVTIPKIAQVSFKAKWRLLPEKPIAKFVLAPLPKDLKLLAQKFPEVGKTFSEVGITKITDVTKIRNANLNLPGLTETVGLAPTNVPAAKFAMVKGVPVAQLSATAKSRIPSNIVFSKAGGGLVDFNIALSVNNKGKTEQRIKTVANSSLQLVVKPEGKVTKVRGYIVFKSKKPAQPSMDVKMKYLAASLVLPDPVFAEPEENIEQRLVLAEFEYKDSGNGVYTATVQMPVVDGEYEIITVMDYEDQTQSKEIKLITVVDPEGYVYEKSGDKETRILGAVVSLYWQSPETKQYELWPAKNFQQENPQTTDIRGTYSFLVPEGYYYLKVDAPGYLSYDGKPFQVTEGSGVHINIELKTKFWFLNVVDWKTFLLVIVVLLLLWNFYKDRMREKRLAASNQ